MRKRPIAILLSDIHLSEKPPIARDSEQDWFEAMKRTLDQVRDFQRKWSIPAFCAGDVFDHWKSSPELINFAIDTLPRMYAVPGQHDLPNHSYKEKNRSAYDTLCKAGTLLNLEPGAVETVLENESVVLRVCGFPWNHKITPVPNLGQKFERKKVIHLAVIHQYCWRKGKSYPGADKNKSVFSKKLLTQLKGFDAAIFGDNHKGFLVKRNNQYILNNGGLMRRSSDEIKRKPSFGVLCSDGSIKRKFLETSHEKMLRVVKSKAEAQDVDLSEFMESLDELEGDDLDFKENLKRTAETQPAPVQEIINKAMQT